MVVSADNYLINGEHKPILSLLLFLGLSRKPWGRSITQKTLICEEGGGLNNLKGAHTLLRPSNVLYIFTVLQSP